MPKVCYVPRKFNTASQRIVDLANVICAEYDAQGFTLTLRQLYYQLVARGYIPNRDTEYKRVGSIINDARLAGALDWNYLEDRTRNLKTLGHWEDPAAMMESALNSYRTDKWDSQDYRPEVWIEKDALVGVIADTCDALDVPYFSCRGYTSQSEMWGAAMRFVRYVRAGKTPVIFHLGDHDPSGIDMSRDIEDRIRLFMGKHLAWDPTTETFRFERIALTMDQVLAHNPPPNPAKITDARFTGYQIEHGDESWELDALDPATLAALITDNIMSIRDENAWTLAEQGEAREKGLLRAAKESWEDVALFLEDNGYYTPDEEDEE